MTNNAKWLAYLEDALLSRDVEKLIELCESHQPSLKKGEVEWIAKRICERWEYDDSQMRQILSALLERSTDTALKLFCELVWQSTTIAPGEAFLSLMQLADHPNWQIREYVASAAGELFDRHFEELRNQVLHLAQVGSPKVKRAIALAVKAAGRSRNSNRVDFLLDVTARLLTEDDPYVMKNLGPFVIGDGLLRYYTDATIVALKKWSRSQNPVVRWNVAMALTTSSARDRAELVKPILESLSSDPDKRVQRAIAKAKRNLYQEKTA